jgi:DNA polymerase delta subunit 4
MPPKRRSTGAAPKATQSTLAFHGASNKVTKPGQRAQNAKKNITDQQAAKSEVADVSTVHDEETAPVETAIVEQPEVAQKAASTPEEDEAERITDARIKKYWAGKEKARKIPRVHQDGLSLQEKILREFDMSAQYGVRLRPGSSRIVTHVVGVYVARNAQLANRICDAALHRYSSIKAVEARTTTVPEPSHRSPCCAVEGTKIGQQGVTTDVIYR